MAEKGRDNSNPFDILKNLGDMKDMKKLLGEDFFRNLPFPQWQQVQEDGTAESDPFPRVDVLDRGDEVMVVLEVPGISSANEIALAVGPKEIYVRGVIAPISSRDGDVYLSERFHGPFEREIELPVRVEESDPKASYSRGLLTVRLKKRSLVEPTGNHAVPISFD
ncbi:MAG: Hsp20/alpha crystallin family protein [Alicyclobacillus sp.]|nr:Hsp20/alpha crystallin family protein [Alicyclobacillus sp.]